MDAAGLFFDAAAKKLETRKMAMMSVADTEAMGDLVKQQLILMTKAGDAVLKYLDKSVNQLYQTCAASRVFRRVLASLYEGSSVCRSVPLKRIL